MPWPLFSLFFFLTVISLYHFSILAVSTSANARAVVFTLDLLVYSYYYKYKNIYIYINNLEKKGSKYEEE